MSQDERPQQDGTGEQDGSAPQGGGAEEQGSTGGWQSHGGAAPSRGPQAADGMAEPAAAQESHPLTGPDGEEVDADVSDGGQSGQDSGSMA